MAGAIYGQFPPLANALRPSGEWQAYDVFFRGPRFGEGGALEEPARLTVLVNGVLVQNNELLPGMTIWLESLPYAPHPRAGAIQLQDHGSPVQFRNLWVRESPDRPAPPAGYGQFDAQGPGGATQYDRLVGTYDRANNEGQFVIERTETGLGMSMPWRPGVLRMIPTSPTTFELAHTSGRLTFDVGADGTPTGLTFEMGGGTYPATLAGGRGRGGERQPPRPCGAGRSELRGRGGVETDALSTPPMPLSIKNPEADQLAPDDGREHHGGRHDGDPRAARPRDRVEPGGRAGRDRPDRGRARTNSRPRRPDGRRDHRLRRERAPLLSRW